MEKGRFAECSLELGWAGLDCVVCPLSSRDRHGDMEVSVLGRVSPGTPPRAEGALGHCEVVLEGLVTYRSRGADRQYFWVKVDCWPWAPFPDFWRLSL